MTARRPNASSCCTACAERNPNPKPARHGLLDRLVAGDFPSRCAGTTPDSEKRLPPSRGAWADPGSRRDERLAQRCARAARGRFAGERMRGCRPRSRGDGARMGSATNSCRVGGWLITAKIDSVAGEAFEKLVTIAHGEAHAGCRDAGRGKAASSHGKEIVARVDHPRRSRTPRSMGREPPRSPPSAPADVGRGSRAPPAARTSSPALGEPQTPPPGAPRRARHPRGSRAGGSGSRSRAA